MENEVLRGSWVAETGSEAPPPFLIDGNLAVPCEVSALDLLFEVDAQHQRGAGHGKLRFTLSQSGRPLFDLVPRPSRLIVDEHELPLERLRTVSAPDDTTPLRMLDEQLDAGVEHTIEVEYTLRNATAQYGNGGVRLGLFMTDLEQRGYLESHAPANLEFDQISMTAEVRISGATHPHQIFTNGSVELDGGNAWRVTFPGYFNCSCCYLHLTDRPVSIREIEFDGAEQVIPIRAYGESVSDLQQALQTAGVVMRELEDTYGPYAHESLLVYCTGASSGGMEYAGATMTSLQALGHEITHSWFARGVMPANGNAGWIDEAIASWRDRGYPRAAAALPRPPVNLAGFSPYRRHTPFDSYALGSLLLSELDLILEHEGLRPLLAQLFNQRKRQVISTPFFQSFLEEQTGAALGPIFDRYVYGKAEDGEAHPHEALLAEAAEAVVTEALASPPPRAFTAEELRALL
ncbi:MAG TPA: hypothetical protein VLB46_12950 [Pyrinomonadaceae bacterium]|nr:hypothetical protein [Pyrinomonadaceae bacterium]